jgi:hypothetical protein
MNGNGAGGALALLLLYYLGTGGCLVVGAWRYAATMRYVQIPIGVLLYAAALFVPCGFMMNPWALLVAGPLLAWVIVGLLTQGKDHRTS